MKRKQHDYGQLLIWSAVAVSMPRWAGAFIAADAATIPPAVDQALHYMNLASGFGMALLEVMGAAYLLDAWGRMKPKRTHNAKTYDHRWVILSGFVLGLFLLMPLILAPYIVARMTAVTVADIGGGWFHAVWSVAVVLSPVFIVGGAAVARDGLVGVTAAPQPETVQLKPDVSRKPIQETEETARQRMERLWKPGMKPTELARVANVSKGYASKYINRGMTQSKNGVNHE